MIKINAKLQHAGLRKKLAQFWDRSAEKINGLNKSYDPSKVSPVFTVRGKYTTRGWTE